MTLDFDAELRAALGPAYEIERELTGSGMSRVFVALERELNRRVVIKVLPPELAAGVNRERFRREIQLAAQLQHPHIVPLHATGARGDLLYFTMPFIEGESLRHALLEGKRFSVREVVRILHNVSDALAYAHTRGVIHRDIKPGNVLRSGAHALVTDFGVAKAISAALPAVGMTTSGMAIGTPQYMAPEQLAGDPAADHRVDIYALGLLAYELLAGEAPFKAPSPQETMAAQLTRAPEPIEKRRGDIPPALAALIARCLAKNPADRPQSAAEVSAVLDEIDVSSGVTIPMRSAVPRGALAIVALAAMALIGAALWLRYRPPSATAPRPIATETALTAPAPPPAPPSLTREDSLAIAAAMERKFAEQRAAARAQMESAQKADAPSATKAVPLTQEDIGREVARIADSLRADIQRSVLDSVTRARGGRRDFSSAFGTALTWDSLGRVTMRGLPRAGDDRAVVLAKELSPEAFAARAASMGPPRRVFVSTPQLRSSLETLGPATDSLADSLRRAIARNPRFIVIDADSARLILERTRTISRISETMAVELFASIFVNLQRDSSVAWTVTVRDLGAHPSYSTRGMGVKSDPGAPLSAIAKLVAQSVDHLREMDRAPRRQSSPVPSPRP